MKKIVVALSLILVLGGCNPFNRTYPRRKFDPLL
ncbi:lipoprotein [Bacillus sp. JRC01]|nr:lipoprotein [Bacillus sp. JRC01]